MVRDGAVLRLGFGGKMAMAMIHEASARERLLAATQQLILSKGFPATSVDEICEVAGVTKGSFFYHFTNKDGAAREVLNRFCGAVMGLILGAPYAREEDPLQRCLGFIDFMAIAS